MKKRQEPKVASTDKVRHDEVRHDEPPVDASQNAPTSIAGASTFDVAQDLLQEALAGFRKPAAARVDQPEQVEQDGEPESAEHRQWRRRLHEDDPAQSERSAAQPESAARPDSNSGSNSDGPTWSASATTATPSAKKQPSRRRSSTPAPPSPTSAPDSDEFDGLTETLYEKPARGTPRRRRPPAVVMAGSVDDSTSPTLTKAELPPTPTSPAADPNSVIDGTTPAPLGSAAQLYERETLDSSRSKQRTAGVLAVVAAALVGVIVIAFALSGGGSDEPALRADGQARLTFDPITTVEGARVTRVWELSGAKGTQFTGELSFSNPTSAPLQTNFTEVIPKSLAKSVSDITFDPEPIVVQADPVVRYSLTVPAGATVTARYEIQVAPDGVQRARLDAWAKELGIPTTTVPTTTPTTTLPNTGTTPPTTVAPTPRPTSAAPTAAPAPGPPATNPPEPPPEPPAETGTLIIRVVSVGATGTFDFSGPGGNVSLTTSGTPNGVASTGFTVSTGTYPWTQAAAAGFRLRNIDCTDRDAGPFEHRSTVSGSTATFNVQAGETVVCTFTNNKE